MRLRTLARLLVVLSVTALWSTASQATATQKPVHTGTNPSPVVIAILSDHYTSETKFDNDVQNFITYGLLAHYYYGGKHGVDLKIESFFDPVDPGRKSDFGFDPDQPSQKCDLSWVEGATNPNDNTAWLVDQVVGGLNPDLTVVIGDYGYNMGCTSGAWSWVGRGAIGGGDILPHELGHGLGTLKDEWVAYGLGAVSHVPGIPLEETRNCYDTRNGATPPWAIPSNPAFVSGAGSVPGCDLYGVDVVHAFPDPYQGEHICLMAATDGAKFCRVCERFMNERFGEIPNPDLENPEEGSTSRPPIPPPTPVTGPGGTRPPIPPTRPQPPEGLRIIKTSFEQPPTSPVKPVVPAPTPPAPKVPPPKLPTNTSAAPAPPRPTLKPAPTIPIIRLVASFDPTNGTITARKGHAINAQYAPKHRRVGRYVYEMVDLNRAPAQQTLDVGVLPSTLFTARSYQGGLQHQSAAPATTDVIIQIPNVTAADASAPGSRISIRIYWLAPGVTDPLITPATLNDLKQSKRAEPRGEITAAQLRDVM